MHDPGDPDENIKSKIWIKAFRVKVHACTVKPPQGDCGDSLYWMAPEAKSFVKGEIGNEMSTPISFFGEER